MASKPICWPPPPNCVNNFWLFINSREWEKYAGSRTFATNVKSNHDGQHGISFDIAPPFQTIQKIGRQNQRVAQQHFYGRRGEHIFLSEKCFQFLWVGSACHKNKGILWGEKRWQETPENQGEKRKRTVHIKYAFPISVYLVFHFLFYVCPDKQPNTDSNN